MLIFQRQISLRLLIPFCPRCCPSYFSKMNKTENFTPWRPVKHFDYNFLRNAFRKVLLEQLTFRIGSTFHKVKNEMYTKYADGFYVLAKPNLCTPFFSLSDTILYVVPNVVLLCWF